ncbi:related to TATA-binding protein-associated factor MOT1 [Hanseniaspora guilliermondii]|uniref:TATA-binding protein-associated factor mot1 n=1 Tax=Hanseniaspora guilliermondii TaxID=56406 RepID=A0A1L0FPQ9_9ASCO|nr:related to TATA-binding protein-associated factor MOT1 [Hanseniaspora guilliermondii]
MTSRNSRLDRQVLLLETGSSTFVRNLAADQLGDLAKQHPNDIISLISRVYPFLLSKKWETRVSSARAIGNIVQHIPDWNPNADDFLNGKVKKEDINENAMLNSNEAFIERVEHFKNSDLMNKIIEIENQLLNLDDYDVLNVMNTKQPLLAASVDSIKEKPTMENKKQKTVPIDENVSSAKSARMKALAKRKLKKSNSSPTEKTSTSKSVDLSNNQLNDIVNNNAEVISNPTLNITEQNDDNKIMLETKIQNEDEEKITAGITWTLQTLYDLLLKDLLSENWELRHGAALGLREIFLKKRENSHYLGKLKIFAQEENDLRNNKYLQDLCCNILNVFALDRFNDFIGDTVVAPVKASTAQTLAVIFNSLNDLNDRTLLLRVFENLEKLVFQKDQPKKLWQVSHGGLLGLLYFTSTKKDFFIENGLIDRIITIVKHGLNAFDDDVQSCAAGILIPLTDLFLQIDESEISSILDILWSCVCDRDDDLSTSISSIMDLLSNLFKNEKIIVLMQQKINAEKKWSYQTLIPMLYRYLRHPITIVRKSVLNLLMQFLEIYEYEQNWIDTKIVRLLLQNILFEVNSEVNELSKTVYFRVIRVYRANSPAGSLDKLFVGFLDEFTNILMTPVGELGKSYPMTTKNILKPSSSYHLDDNSGLKRKHSDVSSNSNINIDSAMINGDVDILTKETILNNRVAAAEVFGETATYFLDQTQQALASILKESMDNPFITSKYLTAIIISEFSKVYQGSDLDWLRMIFEPIFNEHLFQYSSNDYVSIPVYKEMVPSMKSLRAQCNNLLSAFGSVSKSKVPQLPFLVKGEPQAGSTAFDLQVAHKIHGETYDKLLGNMDNATKISSSKTLADFRHRLKIAIQDYEENISIKESVVLSSYATALLCMSTYKTRQLPQKVSPFIKSLMDNLKTCEYEVFQRRSAHTLIDLMVMLSSNGKQNAFDKVLKNLCGLFCTDTINTPTFEENKNITESVYDLIYQEKFAILDGGDDLSLKSQREKALFVVRGAMLAFEYMFQCLSTRNIFDEIPQLGSYVFDPLREYASRTSNDVDDKLGSAMVDGLAVFRQLIPLMGCECLKLMNLEESILPNLLHLLKDRLAILRFSSSMVMAALAKEIPSVIIPFVTENVLPMLNNAGNVIDRLGAIELIKHITFQMGTDILPFVVFFIVPLLGRMSDSVSDVRNLAAKTFATVIKLIPLEEGIEISEEGFSKKFLEGREKERDFLIQMMDPSKIEAFKMPVNINATLRKYQQDGVNWLAFLNKYNLHGILCDDMGLGKTLQTICILGSDQYLRQQRHAIDGSLENQPLPCLIICPPSLTGHWEQEIKQYCSGLSVLVYAGPPSTRSQHADEFNNFSVVVTSYDVVRQDIDVLKKYDYNYCVLDEGHIIKNPHSKLAIAVKELRSNHRLLLTGTPIQNNVVELWSLFDFLMPGFLGTDKTFQERFSKPILQSRNPKASLKDQERGILALEALHKQTLPFMLRRLKDDVLSDLPPKIIQDYYCELSPMQKQLYNDFVKKEKKNVEIEDIGNEEPKQHIFQALQYMRKLCNHPKLVLSENHPQYQRVQEQLRREHLSLSDLRNAPKLMGLKNLLNECGIGLKEEKIISEHRVLVFCQLKDMIDLIENDLFKKHMPDVTYMRLDGSVESRDRQKVVRKFNEDPSIDVLLLTTKVGGLGLNLTGADTVIFVEHDWNPMNDLQAMDRAHRLGQTKVVNVYRIITRGSLEEKIMSLQKFKMNIASTVVNQQNAGLQSMGTDQLLDLFNNTDVESKIEEREEMKEDIVDETGLSSKAKSAMGTLANVWDDDQYKEEYDLNNFIENLK